MGGKKAEKRVDNSDGVGYTWAQLSEHYGEKKAEKIWDAAGKRAERESPKEAKAKVKAKAKVVKNDEADEEPFHLSYFGVMAKGLAPALVAEMSGRAWTATTFKDPAAEWRGPGGLKETGKCPFGQVPLLEVKARGRAPALNLGQATAICSYIARIAKRKSGLEGNGAAEHAMSAMLMAEGEDLYNAMQKNQTTIFAKEYGAGGKASKEDSNKWWAEGAKEQIGMLEKLIATTEGPSFTKGGTTVGEVYLFSMLHQMKLIHGDIMDDAKGVHAWYDATKAHPSIAKVLNKESTGGEYAQYFVNH